jgi:hypothetical protein
MSKNPTTPGALGAFLYESLRGAIASDGELSAELLRARIQKSADELDRQFIGEIVVGAMFGAAMAVERSTAGIVGREILAGMKDEFSRHLSEQGAAPQQVEEWRQILEERFAEYRECLTGYEEMEPPWKLGRLFYWNLTGIEEYPALPIKHATLYLLNARDSAQDLLNVLGPSIALNLPDPQLDM